MSISDTLKPLDDLSGGTSEEHLLIAQESYDSYKDNFMKNEDKLSSDGGDSTGFDLSELPRDSSLLSFDPNHSLHYLKQETTSPSASGNETGPNGNSHDFTMHAGGSGYPYHSHSHGNASLQQHTSSIGGGAELSPNSYTHQQGVLQDVYSLSPISLTHSTLDANAQHQGQRAQQHQAQQQQQLHHHQHMQYHSSPGSLHDSHASGSLLPTQKQQQQQQQQKHQSSHLPQHQQQQPQRQPQSQQEDDGPTQQNQQPIRGNNSTAFNPPFHIDLAMVRRTMDGVNRALGVDLGGTEVGESALMDNPLSNDASEDGELKDGSATKAEMSHVRLISDACGHITANVGRAVLQAAEESHRENVTSGHIGQAPKPPIRKKRGGILGFKELAQRANLSPWHFHRVFRFVTGVTPKAYGEALWEFLMIEAGFDLENEELTINIPAAKSRGVAAGGNSAQNNRSTSSSRSPDLSAVTFTPNSMTSNYIGPPVIAANSMMDGSVATDDLGSAITTSSTGTSPDGVQSSVTSESSSDMQPLAAHQQPIAPLTGTIAPGRVRKASSSRGARSRSRNRTQPQGQVFNGLKIDPTSAEATAAQLNRGRSFSRASMSSMSNPSQVSNSGAQQLLTQSNTIANSSHSPSPLDTPSFGQMHGPKASLSGGDMMMPEMIMQQQQLSQHGSPYNGGGYSFDIPDLNGLSIQQEPPTPVLDAGHPHASSLPTVSPLSSIQVAQQFAQPDAMPSMTYQRANIGKGHARRRSTGAMPQQYGSGLLHHYGGYHGLQQQPHMPKRYHENLNTLDTSPQNSPEATSLNSRVQSSDSISGQQRSRVHDQQVLFSSGNNQSAYGDADGRLHNKMVDSFHDDLQREMFDLRNDDSKHDQLGDLPTSFYMDITDKSIYGDDSNLGFNGLPSELLSDEDPPLMPSWNEIDTADQFLY